MSFLREKPGQLPSFLRPSAVQSKALVLQAKPSAPQVIVQPEQREIHRRRHHYCENRYYSEDSMPRFSNKSNSCWLHSIAQALGGAMQMSEPEVQALKKDILNVLSAFDIENDNKARGESILATGIRKMQQTLSSCIAPDNKRMLHLQTCSRVSEIQSRPVFVATCQNTNSPEARLSDLLRWTMRTRISEDSS